MAGAVRPRAAVSAGAARAPLAIADRGTAAGRRRDRAGRGGSRRRQAHRRRPRRASRTTRRRCCGSAGSCRRGGRKWTASFSRSTRRSRHELYPADAPRRLVVQIYGSGIATQAGKVVEPLQGDRRPRAADPRRRGGLRAFPPRVVRRTRQRRDRAGAVDRRTRRGGSRPARRLDHRVPRGASRAVRRHRWRAGPLDRLELRPAAAVSRRFDARALQQDPERRREPAGVRGIRAQPKIAPGPGACSIPPTSCRPSSATCC